MEPPAGFADFVLDLLAPLGGVTMRRMFGGFGLFRDRVMFAIIAGDSLYMKVDERNRPAFEATGAEPFTYRREGREVALSYYEAPAALFDDADALCDWARGAHQAAQRAQAKGGNPAA